MFEIPKNCCGKEHTAPDITFDIGFDAAQRLPKTLRKCGLGTKILLVADQNTWRAAGEQVYKILLDDGFEVCKKVFERLDCAEYELSEQLCAITQKENCSSILGVGTGTINDLSRYAAYLGGKKYAIFATAPSMDGFCSTGAPLIQSGFKRTFSAISPSAVIGDADILDKAPAELTAAGLGDLLGKYTCLADWQISHLLTGEYYCPGIVKMVKDSVDKAAAASHDIKAGVRGASLPFMEALCITGVAMALCGNSRPASGAEHHLSHFWEMRFLAQGQKQTYHGAKVGVAAVIVSGIYHSLLKISNIEDFVTEPPALTAERLKKGYGILTDEVLKENADNPLDKVTKQSIISHWDEICEIIKGIPSPEEIAEKISYLGGQTEPSQIGVSDSLKKEAVIYGRYARRRLTLLRVTDMLESNSYLF